MWAKTFHAESQVRHLHLETDAAQLIHVFAGDVKIEQMHVVQDVGVRRGFWDDSVVLLQ